MYTSQKRALKEALNAAADREASEIAADEASRSVVAQAAEDEMERLTHQLALTKVRHTVGAEWEPKQCKPEHCDPFLITFLDARRGRNLS